MESPDPVELNPAAETIAASVGTEPRVVESGVTDAPPAIVLEVLGGPMDGVTAHAAARVVTVGRSPGCDLSLHLDPMVSMHHARLVREGTSLLLEDTQSRNGTHVGQQRISGRALVAPGTRFVVGSTCVELLSG